MPNLIQLNDFLEMIELFMELETLMISRQGFPTDLALGLSPLVLSDSFVNWCWTLFQI